MRVIFLFVSMWSVTVLAITIGEQEHNFDDNLLRTKAALEILASDCFLATQTKDAKLQKTLLAEAKAQLAVLKQSGVVNEEDIKGFKRDIAKLSGAKAPDAILHQIMGRQHQWWGAVEAKQNERIFERARKVTGSESYLEARFKKFESDFPKLAGNSVLVGGLKKALGDYTANQGKQKGYYETQFLTLLDQLGSVCATPHLDEGNHQRPTSNSDNH